MYNLVSKFGLYTIVGITVLVLVIAGMSYQSSNDVDLLLGLAKVLIYIAAGAAVILPLINAFKNPKVLLRAGIGIAVLGAIFGITYSTASTEITPLFERIGATAEKIQLSGGLIQMTFVLIIIAVVAVILGELSKAVR